MLRAKPDGFTRSALGHAAYVRDVMCTSGVMLQRVLTENAPELPDLTSADDTSADDTTAADDTAAAGDTAAVAGELERHAEHLASLIDSVAESDWTRTARTGDGLGVDALWIARRAAHEGSHHLLDMGRVLRAVRGR